MSEGGEQPWVMLTNVFSPGVLVIFSTNLVMDRSSVVVDFVGIDVSLRNDNLMLEKHSGGDLRNFLR